MVNNAQTTQFDPAMLSQGMPVPAGTDDNGQPYWIDPKGQRITWAQMQQVLWHQRQSQQASGGGKGFEGAPVMPNIPQIPSLGAETNLEKGPTLNPEKSQETKVETRAEARVETSVNTQGQNAKPQAQQSKNAKQKLLGDSPKLTTVNIEDIDEVHRYYVKNQPKSDDPASSNSYLTTLFGKILRQLAATSK